VIASLAALAIALAAAAVIMLQRTVRASGPGSDPSAATSAASAASASEGATVTLTIEATPTTAQIVVDDVVTSGNPWQGTFPRGSTHSIRVVAPGHAAQVETVTLRGSTILNMQLDRPDTVMAAEAPAPTTPPRAPSASASAPSRPAGRGPAGRGPAAAQPGGPAPAPAQGGAKRAIDPTNPYAQ
jgi:hypothetical protein